MKIEALEDFMSGAQLHRKGEIIDHKCGEVFVNLGWAKPVDDHIKVGERQALDHHLFVHNSIVGA